MNVPPVATTHTEWRRCVAQEGFSLPVFLHDSDSELSASGRPLSDKVQMIIESLRSSQSSLEMGDAIEGNVPLGQEGKPQVCKVPTGSFVGAKSNSKHVTKTQRVDCSYPAREWSSDSDSDDSVDRGIEEAILEYLKEKGDHKRKAEPCVDFLKLPKISRKDQLLSDVSKTKTEKNECMILGDKNFKTARIESSVPRLIPIEKHMNYTSSLNENSVKRLDRSKVTTGKSILLKAHTKIAPKTIGSLNKMQCPVTVNTEKGSDDSSSDGSIEEAIQRYQLEKLEQKFQPECSSFSDSSSDDGIEEAILHYQLEQLKEKQVLEPFLHKEKTDSNSYLHASDGTSAKKPNKAKQKKKRNIMGKDPKCSRSPTASHFIPKKRSSDCAKGKATESVQLTVHSCKDQHASISAPPKVNTTAELMCAEAILDISKTVMPDAFPHTVGLCSTIPTDSHLQVSIPQNCVVQESDSSSDDSEDEIEQEIQKFLEQKAQMQKQLNTPSANPQDCQNDNSLEQTKVVSQKKPFQFSKIRKHSSISNIPNADRNIDSPSVLPRNGKQLNSLLSNKRRQTGQLDGFHQIQQNDDKSSSFDSDADLDTAIKDLLKTKKRSKRKNKDLKWKSRKDDGQTLGKSVENKTLKSKTIFTEKKNKKGKKEPKRNSVLGTSGVSLPKQPQKDGVRNKLDNKKEELKATEGQNDLVPLNPLTALQSKEDSSSADSDDGIEQEIQRFLAEKAKASSVETSQERDASTNSTAVVCSQLKDGGTKQTGHLPEVPVQNHSPKPGQLPPCAQLPLPQNLHQNVPTADVQCCQTPAQSSSPSHLDPAEGAGATRSEQASNEEKVDVPTVTPQAESFPYSKHALSSPQSVKWRQSLGLPTPKSWTFGQTSFHITRSEIGKTASASPQFPRRPVTPRSQPVWSAARTSRGPSPFSKETLVNATTKSQNSNSCYAARQQPRFSFTQDPTSVCPGLGETKSLVSVPKDRCVFVELESNRTNHVQVQSQEALPSEWKKEGEIRKTDDKFAQPERKEEEFIDEADCELSNRVNPDKKQGFPTL